jgi:hypothetical protein
MKGTQQKPNSLAPKGFRLSPLIVYAGFYTSLIHQRFSASEEAWWLHKKYCETRITYFFLCLLTEVNLKGSTVLCNHSLTNALFS